MAHVHLDIEQQRLLRFLFEQYYEGGRDEQEFLRVLAMLFFTGNQRRELAFRRPNIDRQRASGHDRLMRDYFSANPVYCAMTFRRRFRMQRPLFRRIEAAVTQSNDYFVQKADALGVLGLTSLQKVTAAIRMLAYDRSADDLDEYMRIGETTSFLCLTKFCETVISVFGNEYLRSPTATNMERILRHSASRGFPGMLGSLDCMHWDWKNCPRAWAGQFSGRSKKNSVVLEAVATYDLWIWHAFFGMPGSQNDLNVLDRSPLFSNLLQGLGPRATFVVNSRVYDMCYYLTDGIYPKWPVFIHTISNPLTEKRKYFAARQESVRKDIERCFGVLRARFAILRNPSRLWQRSALHSVITCCIILHNMIVEDELHNLLEAPDVHELEVTVNVDAENAVRGRAAMAPMLQRRRAMRNQPRHQLLQNDLIEHLWLHRHHE